MRAKLELVGFYREQVIALARENRRLAEQALQAGQVDMTVVLETQREVILSEFQLNQLEGSAALSLIELEYAVGGSLGRGMSSTRHRPAETETTSLSGHPVPKGASS